MSANKNLVFIIIDGLSQLEFPLFGEGARFIPTFHKLAAKGYVSSKCFAHGTPTEFAIPSLLSSSLPLEYGGYQYGLLNRPVTLFDQVKQQGYRTSLFTKSFILDRLFGFGRGLDHLQSFYEIESLWRYMRRTFLFHIIAARETTKDHEHFYQHAAEVLNRFFVTIHQYADHMAKTARELSGSASRIYHHDFKSIMRRLEEEFSSFQRDQRTYIDCNLNRMMKTGLEEYLGLGPIRRRIRNLLARWDGRYLPGTEILFRGYEKNAPSEQVFASAMNWIMSSDQNKPFATTIHLMDIHDGLCSGERYFLKRDPEISKLYCQADPTDLPPERHMQALAYVDRCLAVFTSQLESLGILDQTCFVVTSDHGTVWHNKESCLASSTPAGSFKDIFLSIPFLVSGPGVSVREDENLQQSMNIAPTILDMLEIDIPAQFQGHSAFDNAMKLDYVIAEHTHRGPCDPFRLPIYMGIRSNNAKYIWKEAISIHDRGPALSEQLFDLRSDPNEETNLIGQELVSDLEKRFRNLRAERVDQIRKQAPFQWPISDLLTSHPADNR